MQTNSFNTNAIGTIHHTGSNYLQREMDENNQK